ncbi:polyprenyl synthetase family protein [Serinibacter salmoneus]|uniref:Geranylgeranyl diphosphate synthase type I n=1 Tax=Serinibacter salmoneus TaxID=556530 RepID=A0A2A9D0P4_9MICO|nr:polyprenyl synthetase family protein [Serinibacter salmoneus]PFG19522.1 geranylgeranyl diphosphate synthase type I [Serinibacter salmoneus]
MVHPGATQAPDEELRGRLDAAIAAQTAALEPWAREVGGELDPFLRQAGVAVRGGKRLRALLCLAAHEVASGPDLPDHVIQAAAALELFQAAALVHDDLMDGSDTRRGEPSAHRALELASPGGRDRAGFGAGGAILLGDLLLARSSTVLFEATRHAAGQAAHAAARLYSDMATEVAVGQYLDLLASHAPWDDDVDLERAFRVIRAKSARYSVEIPLALGATLAGARETTIAWLRDIGHEIGTAFQLRDDLLGVFGEPERTGKPAGDDLREGKRTVLVALAHAEGDATLRERLERDLGRGDLTAGEIQDLTRAIDACGARRRVEHIIAEHRQRAADLLSRPPAGVTATARLERLLRAAVDRSV